MAMDTGDMRHPFVHEAVIVMEPNADARAPGAAVTVALCDSWDHDPPCPLAPHHTRADRSGDELRVRTLFATEPQREADVRRRIDAALRAGEVRDPDGVTTRWLLRDSGPGVVADEEAEHAGRLVGG